MARKGKQEESKEKKDEKDKTATKNKDTKPRAHPTEENLKLLESLPQVSEAIKKNFKHTPGARKRSLRTTEY